MLYLAGASGLTRLSQTQWQPKVYSHDPNPPITIQFSDSDLGPGPSGGTSSPAPPMLRVVSWQYQSHAQPVFVPAGGAETITIDKWYQRPSEPLRRAAAIAALIGATLSAPVDVPAAAPYDPAGLQWHRQTSEPVRARPPLPVGAVYKSPVPVSLTPALPTWAPDYPDSTRKRVLGPAGAPFYFAPVEPIAAPGFNPANGFPWPQPEVPRRLLVGRTQADSVEPVRFRFPEAFLDWVPDEPVVMRRTPRFPWGASVLDPFPLPGAAFNPADGFPYVRQPDLVPGPKRVPWSFFVEPVRFAFPEAALDWLPDEPVVVRRTPRVPWSGFVLDPFPLPGAAFNPADGFPWVRQPDFAPGRRPQVHSQYVQPVRFAFPEATLDWLPDEPTVIRRVPRFPWGAFLLDPLPIPGAAFQPGDGFPWVRQPDFAYGRRPVPHSYFVQPIRFAFPEARLDWLPDGPVVVRRIARVPHAFYALPFVFDPASFPWVQLPAYVPGRRQPLRLEEIVEPFTAALFDPARGFPYPHFPAKVWPRSPLRWAVWFPAGPVEPAGSGAPQVLGYIIKGDENGWSFGGAIPRQFGGTEWGDTFYTEDRSE